MNIPKQVNTKLAVGLLLISVILASGLMYVFAATPSTTFWIAPGLYPGAPSYTIWKDGSNYFSKTANGEIEFSGTNASEIIQQSEDVIEAAGGGTLYFERATYAITAVLTVNASHIHWIGEAGVIFSSSNCAPIFRVTGGALYGGAGTLYTYHDIVLDSLTFYYTGSPAPGTTTFVDIDGVQAEYDLGAVGCYMKNVQINSSQNRVISTNTGFIGLHLTGFCNVVMDSCNIANFGTCIEMDDGVSGQQCDNARLDSVTLSFATTGIWFPTPTISGVNRITATNLKILNVATDDPGYGINASDGSPTQLILINPQFESIQNGTGIFALNTNCVIIGAVFSNCEVGVLNRYNVVLQYCTFGFCETAIINYAGGSQGMLLCGNMYSGCTADYSGSSNGTVIIIGHDSALHMCAYGSSTGTGAVQYIAIDLITTPAELSIAPLAAGTTVSGLWANASYITVTVTAGKAFNYYAAVGNPGK